MGRDFNQGLIIKKIGIRSVVDLLCLGLEVFFKATVELFPDLINNIEEQSAEKVTDLPMAYTYFSSA
jgi:hypothetical protein